ncbi:hypothetical protein GTQ34_16485 [Muricauda sp. JGD-17]|uniref:Tail fiber protein n=1 Tax=Flagellimonas ochracea TaxID=2696472 RepID=A0A964WYR6_9FLAO|nr:hypothetical protein [Allomuricauda ochracea]NAY93506.1 hypothetical protein [Allomuricauda ochracea]
MDKNSSVEIIMYSHAYIELFGILLTIKRKSMVRRFLLMWILVFTCVIVYPQENCNEIIKQGIREYSKTQTFSNDYLKTKQAVKDIYDSYQMDKDVGKASAKYAGVFKGKGSYSGEEIEKVYKLYWSEDINIKEITKDNSYESSYIDPNFVELYKTCVQGNQNNVSFKINTYGEKMSNISITAQYKSNNINLRPKINSVLVDTTEIQISGSLWEQAKKGGKLNEVLTLNASRKDINPQDSIFYPDQGRYVLAKPIRLTLQFSSFSSTFIFPEIPMPKKAIELKKGIGEIVASMMTKAQFYDEYGDGWMLADGSPAPLDSPYRLHIGDSIPDLRGVFLRGKNHGQDSIKGNPEKKDLGEFQEDAIKRHTHQTKVLRDVPKNSLTPNVSAYPYRAHKDEKTGENEDGAEETRPKNVTVNYFIRVK